MITFLVVSAILNLAAGYALAVYLRDDAAAASLTAYAAAPNVIPAQQTSATSPAPPVDQTLMSAAAAVSLPIGAPAPEASAKAPIKFHEDSSHRTEPDTQRNGVDEDLLAGIEEFRNQLAQLKTKTVEDSPMAVLGGV